jgi:hypothetical protein
MSLNSIKFEPTDIASLYKNSLVEINAKQPVLSQPGINTEPVATGWKYLGENKKKTLVIVRNAMLFIYLISSYLFLQNC